jgi:hypothetical protein
MIERNGEEEPMDCTLEVVIVPVSEIMEFSPADGGTFFGFSDPDGDTSTVQQLKVRGEKPLIPVEHRGRSGA